jgi:hypothetical protein
MDRTMFLRLRSGSGVGVARPIVGQLRALGNGFADDTGPRQVRFTSWFPALRIWRDDRAEAERTLDLIAEAGWHGIRIFTAVGSSWWDGREVVPYTYVRDDGRQIWVWPDYGTVLESFLAACLARGLRLHLTAGDLQIVAPGWDQKVMLAQFVARAANTVGPEVIGLYEACNEGWQNGVETPYAARQLCSAFHSICPQPLVGTSSPPSDEGADQLAWSEGMPILIMHGPRDRERAARSAFGEIYWDGDIRPWKKAYLQGETVGSNATYPDCQPSEQDPAYVLAVYAAQQLTGQGSVFFSGPVSCCAA